MSYPSKRFKDIFVCHQVYDETVDFSMLYSHKPVEISIIVSGSGIHNEEMAKNIERGVTQKVFRGKVSRFS